MHRACSLYPPPNYSWNYFGFGVDVLRMQQRGGSRHPSSSSSAGGAAAASSVAAAATASPSGYNTLAVPTTMSTEVKNSKFRATAWPVTSAAHAAALIGAAEDLGATHNCWAYQVERLA